MNKSLLWSRASTLGLLIAAALAAEARAAEGSQETTIEGLVVTAERRVENLESVPIPANVLTEETLAQKQVLSIDDLEFATPSLTISSGGQSNYMNIRGIGKNDNAGNTTSAVATYRDGVGTVSGFFNGEPYYDIKSVEVLRGPQGTFVGQNAAGGAIFVNTRDPDPVAGFGGWAELGVGNYARLEASGALNIPFSDTFAARIAFSHMQRDSFYDVFMDPAMTIRNPNHVGDRDLNSLRIGLLWRPTDNFEVKLKVDLNKLDFHGNAFSVIPGYPLARGLNLSDDIFTIGNNITDNYYVDLINRAALEANYTFNSGVRLRSITGLQYIDTFLRNDDDGSVIPNPLDPAATGVTTQINIQGVFRVFSQEVALISPDEGRFNWILGAYYQRENLKFPETHPDLSNGFFAFDTTTGIPGLALVWDTTRITEAVFGQASYQLTDAVQLQVGLRYTDYHVDEAADLFIGFWVPTMTPREEDRRLTGKAALNWQVNEDNFLYAFVATGHTTGGVGVVNYPALDEIFFGLFGVHLFEGVPVTFGPQETTDYEVGWKAKFFDGALHTQVGLFYTHIDGYQANFAVPGISQNLSIYQNLEGATKVYGVELTGQGAIGDFSFDFNAALIHSSAGSGETLDTLAGTTTADTIIQLAGHRLPYTPSATFSVGAQYRIHIGGEATLTPRVDYAWAGEQRTNLYDRTDALTGIKFERVPAHHNVNAELILEHGDWRVIGYINNLTDEHYIQASGGGGDNAYANEPRQFGVRVHRKF